MRTIELEHRDLGAGFFALVANALSAPVQREAVVARRERAVPLRETHGRGWLERFDAWMWKQEMRSREAYLAKAADVHDLEARLRQLERGAMHRNF